MRWLAALGTGAALLAAGVPLATGAAAPVSPEIAAARLQGTYSAAGAVTQAVGIPDEHRGDLVTRTWSFISPCPSGACPVLGLHRQRAGGTDAMFLNQTAPGVYSGTGAFSAAVRCRGRLYRAGVTVPYTVTVQVTAATAQADGSELATSFTAVYRNRQRVGHTPCFQPPSYDSASYAGTYVSP